MEACTPFRFVKVSPVSPSWDEFCRPLYLYRLGPGREALAALCLYLARHTSENHQLLLDLPARERLLEWLALEEQLRGNQLLIHTSFRYRLGEPLIGGIVIQ